LTETSDSDHNSAYDRTCFRFHRSSDSAWLFIVAGIANAQYTTGSLTGVVSDPTGAAVSDARVTVRNVATSYQESVSTGQDGSFAFPRLRVGTYELTAERTGFDLYVQNGITISVNQAASVSVPLTVGAQNQRITVSADTELVTVSSPTVSQVIDQTRILDLPLNGREAQTLVFLGAGAADVTSLYPAFGHQGGVYPGEQEASVNGSDPESISYQLDGGDHNDTYINLNLPFPNPDALREFSLQSDNISAAYGNSASGVVNVVTRSGTNEFHGDVFEFLRNGDLNARNFFAPTQDTLKRNQFGGAVGGPVLKNKLFFFGTYQGTRIRSTSESQISQVPTAAERNGDFSAISAQISDPISGTPFPGNQIPLSRFSPPALYFLQFIPLPNGPGTQLTYAGPSLVQDENQWMGKADYVSGKNQISGHYFWTKFNEPPATPTQDILATDSQGDRVRVQEVAANYTYTLTPSALLNTFFSWSQQTGGSLSGAPFGFPKAGVNIASANPPELDLQVNGYFQVESGHLGEFDRGDWTVRENVVLSEGKHQLSLGGEVIRLNNDLVNTFTQSGQFVFSNLLSGDNLTDFLLGQASGFRQGGGEFKNMTGTRLGLYAEDTWRLTSKLTLTAGLRWDPYFPYQETAGRVVCFVPGSTSKRYPNAPTGLIYGGDPGCPKAGADTELGNWAPRIGFAERLTNDGKTSIRGGFGIYYVPPATSEFNPYADAAPFSPLFQLSDVSFVNPYASVGITNPFPAQYGPTLPSSNVAFTLPVTLRAVFAKDFNASQVYAWNFRLERQLGKNLLLTASYVGNKGTHLYNGYKGGTELNPAIYVPGQSTEANTQARRAYSSFSNIGLISSEYNSHYNGLQLVAEKRFSQGFSVLANYTFSKKIDDCGSPTTDPFDRSFDRGVGNENIPNIFHLSGVWNLPHIPWRGWTGAVVNGWELSTNLIWQSGFPVTIYSGVDNSFSGVGNDRADYIGGPASLSSSRPRAQQIAEWFNTSVFTVNAVGTYGNSGKNILYGPRLFNTDFALIKNTALTEHARIQFRAEFFNLFNTVNLGLPDNTVTDSTFGQITSAGDPRIIQFGLKAIF